MQTTSHYWNKRCRQRFTPFETAVFDHLSQVPAGKVISYPMFNSIKNKVESLNLGLSLSRWLNKAEADIDCTKKAKGKYMTNLIAIEPLKRLKRCSISIQFDQHIAQIQDLKESQAQNFAAVFGKLDRIIANE